MKAVVLVKTGDPRRAFQIQDLPEPVVAAHQVSIDVDVFGLNFADVVARLGQYRDCPPLPTVIGYEVVGRVAEVGSEVYGLSKGQRVMAFTRFGGYARRVVTDARAVVPISEDLDAGMATALCVQYCTAYFAAEYITRLHAGEHVLVQSAAGGVGTALVQLAKLRGCVIYGTAGSEKKMDYLREQGVDYPINYQKEDFAKYIAKKAPNGKVQVVFDAVGGSSVRKGLGILQAGGRIVCYGAAVFSERGQNIFGTLKHALSFGIYHPAQLMMASKSLMGVNMLRVADEQPLVLQHCLRAVADLAMSGAVKPVVDTVFPIEQLPEAHEKLEFRGSIGKIAVKW